MTGNLERAIEVHDQWLAQGQTTAIPDLLAAHPDLAELLAALVADEHEVERALALSDGALCELGDFRLLAELGRGGMGVVYRAHQLSLGRDVALKVLTSHVTRHPSAVARFKREATLAAHLEHPHIVAIHTVGQFGDAHFFAMELIEGGTLTRCDPATGDVRSVRRTVELCAKVAGALAYAHEQGVLHRDVKPGNILLRTDGEPVLTDFGLARRIDDPGVTASGSFAGTPWYASPEQLVDSSKVDARSDVWSLGATLYELLTGRRPFAGDSTPGVAESIRTSDPIDPLRLVPELAADLAAIVMKALEKPPERRYQSASALRDDLLAFLEFRPVAARRLGAVARTVRWSRRHPGWSAPLALLGVALLVVPVIVSVAVTGERDRAREAEHVARRHAYGANVTAASTALVAGDGALAAQRLAACPADLRGFEWRLVQHSLDRSLWSARASSRAILAVALSSDADALVAADEAGGLALFDTRTGTERWRQPPPATKSSAVVAVAFTAGGDAILVAHAHGEVHRLAARDGSRAASLPGRGEPVAITLAAEGRAVVRSDAAGRLEIFDAALQRQAVAPFDRAVDRPRAGLVSDGTTVVGSPQLGGFVAWEPGSGRVQHRPYDSQPELLAAADALVRVVAFDGRSGFTWWDRAADSLHRMHHGARQITCIDVAPDGRWLCAGGRRGEVLVYDLGQARLVRSLLGHEAPVGAIAIGAAGWMATGDSDGTIRFWNTFDDAGVGEVAGVGFAASLSGAGFGRSLAIDATGALFTGGLDGTVRCLEPRTGVLRWQRQLPHWVNGLAVIGHGDELLVTWHDRMQRFAIADGTARGDSVQIPGMAYVRRLVMAPDGRRCAVLDDAGCVVVVDTATGGAHGPTPLVSLRTSRAGGLAWTAPDSLWVGGEDGAVHRAEPTTLAVAATFPVEAAVTAMAVDGDALLVATWDTARRRGTLSRHADDGRRLHARDLASLGTAVVAFDNRLAVSRLDGRLALHDRTDLAPIAELPQPATALWNVAAHADGAWLAVQCHDGEPRVLAAVDALPTAGRRERALRAAAGHVATETLAPTGWSPLARRRIAARDDLPDELRAAAVAALPPAAAWRLRDIALHLGFSATVTEATRARLAEVHECLLEALPTVDAAQRTTHALVIALVELRLGRLDTTTGPLADEGGAELSPWWAAIRHFLRCTVFTAHGQVDRARTELEGLRRALAACDDEPPGVLHEAEAGLGIGR